MYGYGSQYDDVLRVVEDMSPEQLNAIRELSFSGCGDCEKEPAHRFAGLLRHLIREKADGDAK